VIVLIGSQFVGTDLASLWRRGHSTQVLEECKTQRVPDLIAPKPASPATAARQQTVQFTPDPADFERATRGRIAEHATGTIKGVAGNTVWDVNRYEFLRNGDSAPDTVNPSLWSHAQLDAVHGLFEVAPGVWQARGYDISNITFMAGATGWIIIDPLTVEETARASLELANATLGERPVVAVIYTHSHADHFGGVLGVTTQADVDAGRCIVIAPEGFLHETVAENIIGGPAMGRRSVYQFGNFLAFGPRSHVECGLGMAMPLALPGLIAPTHDITFTGQEMVVDGIRVIFQFTPETEAPSEMNFFFPEQGWLCMAENCSHTMHNLVPIRGAQVRDSLAWSKYIDESIALFGADTNIMFTSHHWPRWGNEDVLSFLALQRDLYRWMHDQTMRYANHGLVATEIAELLELPAPFTAQTHTRGYYGHLVHNVKAVYQRYLSWYDGNPAHLHQHPPVEAGKRYVEFMGGADELLTKARKSFEAGDYRWVAEVVNHLVFADPTNAAARELQADTLEQLGYQTESATFRNAYLTGAYELRQGPPPSRPVNRAGMMNALTIEFIFDAMAIRLKSEEVVGLRALLNFRFTDIGEEWILGLDNCAVRSRKGRLDSAADCTLTMTRETMLGIVGGTKTFIESIGSGEITLEGNGMALANIFGHLDTFMGGFPIVEP
jgi:alkyl sulfatase BDS1-like metallo-beta-lactamase superfamily hydrolase